MKLRKRENATSQRSVSPLASAIEFSDIDVVTDCSFRITRVGKPLSFKSEGR